MYMGILCMNRDISDVHTQTTNCLSKYLKHVRVCVYLAKDYKGFRNLNLVSEK